MLGEYSLGVMDKSFSNAKYSFPKYERFKV